MFVRRILPILAIVLTLSGAAAAREGILPVRGPQVLRSGPGTAAKAELDTINLMSTHQDPTNGPGEPAYFGDFEDIFTNPAWNGWTSIDLSVPEGENHWQVSDYRAIHGGLGAYCGDPAMPSCAPGDTVGGYGHSYVDILEWRRAVANPALPCTVSVDVFESCWASPKSARRTTSSSPLEEADTRMFDGLMSPCRMP